jgi:thymidylate synthase
MQFKAKSLDDAMGLILRRLVKSGHSIVARKGPAREFRSALVEISNPRARFSRTENRATLFSCLGETLWYLAGSDKLKHIEYYIPAYRTFIDASEDAEHAPGAYGPRLYRGGETSQMSQIVAMLKEKLGKSDTRQALAQVFRQSDLKDSSGDVPCTTTLQFLPRRGRLHMIVTMRSNDVYLGFPHDVFAFTFIQELVARQLNVEMGTYSHFVGSLHLYDRDEINAHNYLNEGWQSQVSMPPMPKQDPNPGLAWLLGAEITIRAGGPIPDHQGIDPYWVDLARILRLKALLRERSLREIIKLKSEMSSGAYNTFIRGKQGVLEQKLSQQGELPGLNVMMQEKKEV